MELKSVMNVKGERGREWKAMALSKAKDIKI